MKKLFIAMLDRSSRLSPNKEAKLRGGYQLQFVFNAIGNNSECRKPIPKPNLNGDSLLFLFPNWGYEINGSESKTCKLGLRPIPQADRQSNLRQLLKSLRELFLH